MSHAMAQAAEWELMVSGQFPAAWLEAWRGPEGRAEYKQHMAWADEPRQGDRDERGNLVAQGTETVHQLVSARVSRSARIHGQPV